MTTARIGHAVDYHNLTAGSTIVLGGVRFSSPFAIVAHSDGDIVLHALAEAIYGALGEGDLGTHFSDHDEINRNTESTRFLEHALNLLKKNKYSLSNADLTIVCERIGMSQIRSTIIDSLKELTGCKNISVKATRFERNSMQIACHCVVMIDRPEV